MLTRKIKVCLWGLIAASAAFAQTEEPAPAQDPVVRAVDSQSAQSPAPAPIEAAAPHNRYKWRQPNQLRSRPLSKTTDKSHSNKLHLSNTIKATTGNPLKESRNNTTRAITENRSRDIRNSITRDIMDSPNRAILNNRTIKTTMDNLLRAPRSNTTRAITENRNRDIRSSTTKKPTIPLLLKNSLKAIRMERHYTA